MVSFVGDFFKPSVLENCQLRLIIWGILKLTFEKERDAFLFSIFLIFRWSSESVCGMVLWWKPQVCPGSPLAQGIFNLVRNLKNVYELSVAHVSPFLRSAKITNSRTILGNFWFNNWWVGYFFFFFEIKKTLQAVGAGSPCACSAAWLPSIPSPVKQSGKHRDKSFGVSLLLQSSGVLHPNAPDFVHLLLLICAARIVYLAMLLLIYF